MDFAPEQQAGIKKFKDWFENSNQQVFRIFGYAGTGKTTLAKHLAESINGKVIFAAFTGKAAHVLQTKGCAGAQTIHSLIYHSRDKSKAALDRMVKDLADLRKELAEFGKSELEIENHPKVLRFEADIKSESDKSDQPMFILNRESDIMQAALVCIDECSMVDKRMGEDLLSFGVKILVLGDPAQLPPVGGEGFFTKDVKPDVMLTEIHRQAAESPIIRMATDVRNFRNLRLGDWGDGCFVHDKGTKLTSEQMLSFDQILVGKNVTRRLTNNKLRTLKGIEDPYPVVNDRLVCLRNNSELGLLNGALFTVAETDGAMDAKVFMKVCPEGELNSIEVSAHEHHFLGSEDELKWYEKKEAQEFAFGYALTCHKSQGSQWKKVCVFDESYCFRAEKHKWLYTAITRASDELDVVRM